MKTSEYASKVSEFYATIVSELGGSAENVNRWIRSAIVRGFKLNGIFIGEEFPESASLFEECFDDISVDAIVSATDTFDHSKGTAKTWIYGLCVIRSRNWIRDREKMPKSISDHADRGGVSSSQATDRLLYDHTTERSTGSEFLKIGPDAIGYLCGILPDRDAAIIRGIASGIPKGDIAKSIGISGARLSQILHEDKPSLLDRCRDILQNSPLEEFAKPIG